jgi:hypothetical protein
VIQAIRWMALACSGFQGLVQQQTLGAGTGFSLWVGFSVRNDQTRYWALRQQARGRIPVGGCCAGLCLRRISGVGVLVVALLWWWGVVFDLWIVVASI